MQTAPTLPSKPITREQKAVSILRKAADTIEQRAKEYGYSSSDMFSAIALESNKTIDDVFDVLIALKLVRLQSAPHHVDSLVDLIAYTALKHATTPAAYTQYALHEKETI